MILKRHLAGAVLVVVAGIWLPGCTRGDLGLALVANGFDAPVFATSPAGDTARLFVVEQGGRIWVVKNGVRLDTPFLDISTQLGSSSGEQGLLGLAFHPDFAANGFFYLHYTNADEDMRIARFTAGTGSDVADAASELVLLDIEDPFSNHNGGMLAFGPDGYLYIGIGDGGSEDDPQGNGQNLNTLLGKMLRIDVDAGSPYRVPADNPFVGQPNSKPEIWAYGLRNPWRFSFDRSTGDLYIGDVGGTAREEVDFQRANSAGGENYGWRNREGTICRPGESDCDLPGAVEPIYDYSQPLTRSITGGYVYRGAAIPAYAGDYFFADYPSGQVWSLHYEGTTLTRLQRQPGLTPPGFLPMISSFGEDANGELYVVDYRGAVYRIVANSAGTR
jgi:glucose/arabinose dehydrogenase